jgi:2-dehydro-3-deoxyphosphogluconate aldolase / (4S)-4-hydroxy-2-oxoglutarate aldolase
MHKKEKTLKVLQEQKLLPLYYHDNAETSLQVLQALYEAGVRSVEYTNRGVNALKNFKVLRKAANKNMKDLLLGIGTIKQENDAFDFMEAGADFVVCPTINKQVGRAVQDEKLLWIPGCMTPTEISIAEEYGASVVKIFPGNLLGPAYIRSIKELFPKLKFIPTGGVEANPANLKEWFDAGVIAVGMGSKLISAEILDQKNMDALKAAAGHALELVRKAAQISTD